LLKVRTLAGLTAARKEGRASSRPPTLKHQERQEIVRLVRRGRKAAANAACPSGVHPATAPPTSLGVVRSLLLHATGSRVTQRQALT
jgi:DNA invertase Pin-like site-specific DNA recombinase